MTGLLDQIGLAIESIQGFAYMLQLVGYWAWASSGQNSLIQLDAVETGIEYARCDMEDGILENTYRGLSEQDKNFVKTMLADKQESSLTDAARRIIAA